MRFFAGRENLSISKEMEEKLAELETKMSFLEGNRTRRRYRRERSGDRASPIDDRSLRRLRRKSLDSAVSSESMKLIARLSNLEGKINGASSASSESLNTSTATEIKSDSSTSNRLACIESVVSAAREKITECRYAFNLLKSYCKNKTGGDKLNKLEDIIGDLGDILSLNVNECELKAVKSSTYTVMRQLEDVLREKLTELRERKASLRESGRLRDADRLDILAEKMAFEGVIIARIREALDAAPVHNDGICERLLGKEVSETLGLMSTLRDKLNGVRVDESAICGTGTEELVRVLTKRLLVAVSGVFHNASSLRGNRKALKRLENEQEKLEQLYGAYKAVKLSKLADALASEATALASDRSCVLTTTVTKRAVDDMWKSVRDAVNSELVQSEINHVLARTAEAYEENVCEDNKYFFSFFAYERAALELWSDNVDKLLKVEVRRHVDELAEMFQNSLNKFKSGEKQPNEMTTNAGALLNEFAGVVAHKALIDARVHVFNAQFGSLNDGAVELSKNFLNDYLQNEKRWECASEGTLEQVSDDVEAQFWCMLKRHEGSAIKVLEKLELNGMRSVFQELYADVAELMNYVSDGGDFQNQINVNTIQDISRYCEELREKISSAKKLLVEMKSGKR